VKEEVFEYPEDYRLRQEAEIENAEDKRQRDWIIEQEELERKRLRALILGEPEEEEAEAAALGMVPMNINKFQPLQEVDETDESLFIPQPLPPLPSVSTGPVNEGRDASDSKLMPPPPPRPLPYNERPEVQPLPFDPSNPWKNAGLMRDIGGVDGFVKVQKGTHRFPNSF